jgi:excisionase family DNA binding protein
MAWPRYSRPKRHAMRDWTTKEAKLALEWARTPSEARPAIEEIASQLGRSVGSVQQFLRRVLPRGQWPWAERPRWSPEEIAAAQNGATGLRTRSSGAVKKYLSRQRRRTSDDAWSGDARERPSLTITQAAEDLGLSRASVYRLLEKGALRRFKGGVAESSFRELLREHPEVVPYSKLPRDHREWLVLNGYFDPTLAVKGPSVKGLLE